MARDGEIPLPPDELPTLAGEDASSRFDSDAPTLVDPEAPTLAPGAVAAAAAAAPARARIGHYTILNRLGEGGMGVVYEAMQENPHRVVALKIIRGAFAGEQAIRMFQREAQVLGRLRHPGIAAIYESGRTEDGQHFFAMELVRGVRLDEYLRLHTGEDVPQRTRIRHRLDLFLLLCDAVSYAHQRGVIHRDLKPANVLVQEPETKTLSIASQMPSVKVLDFGLARLTDEEGDGPSPATLPGAVQGTVPYMSPEQVLGQTELVDVRSDVYALGVMLYEMLTGEFPYDLRHASLLEAARIISETPPRPLPPALAKTPIGRDLSVIVRKALEKDPQQRYQSVAALGEDIRRACDDRPILAQPPSSMYQVRKLVARHRVGVAAAAAVIALLVIFAVGMAIAARRIASQRDRANREAQLAQQVSGFLTNLFQASTPERAQGKTVTARQLLDAGAANIQKDRSMNPEVKASLLDTIGSAYSSLGFFTTAAPMLQASLAARMRLFGPNSQPVANSLRDLGLQSLARGDDKQATLDYQKALAIEQRTEGPVNSDVAALLNDVGTSLYHRGMLPQAQSYFQRSLAMRTKLDGPDSPKLIPMRANLAEIAATQKNYVLAAAQFQKDLALVDKIYGPEAPAVSVLENDLGAVMFIEKKYDQAEGYYQQALTLNRKLLGDQHPQVGLNLANLAQVRDAQGDLRGAATTYRQALQILSSKVPATGESLRFVNTNLGSVLVRLGGSKNLHDAQDLLQTALSADEQVLPPGAWDIADVKSELGGCLLAQGNLHAAEPLLVDSFPTLQAKLGANDPIAITRALRRLVALYQGLHQPAQARPYAQLLRTASQAGASSSR
ncbi:MAG: protein kinase domain-containing protein [Terriglobales bacterium]